MSKTPAPRGAIHAKLAGFFDCRMSIQMLQWLATSHSSDYDPATLKDVCRELLLPTCWTTVYEHLIGEQPPPEMLDRAEATKKELMSINAGVTAFVSCMVTVGGEISSRGPASVLDRKGFADWSSWWNARNAATAAAPQGNTEGDNQQPAASPAPVVSFSEKTLKDTLRVGQIFLTFGELEMARKHFWTYLDVVCDYCTEARDDVEGRLAACWGYLAASLALLPPYMQAEHASSEEAWENDQQQHTVRIAQTIMQVDQLIDQCKATAQQTLMRQVWLLHWTCWAICIYYLPRLVLYAKESKARPAVYGQIEWLKVLDYLVGERSMTIMRSCCPHLIRYIAVMATLNRRRESLFQASLEYVKSGVSSASDNDDDLAADDNEQEERSSSTPTTNQSDCFAALLAALFVDYDFQAAQERLVLCQQEASSDFLLIRLAPALEEAFQLLLFETHCRTQRSICIASMAQQLQMTEEKAEHWIVGLIRHSSLAAKIDSEKGRVQLL